MISDSSYKKSIPVQELANADYLDFIGGKGVFSLGYSYSTVTSKIGNVLASKYMLGQIPYELPGDLKVGALFSNAREALSEAITLARLVTARQKIICTQNVKNVDIGPGNKVVPCGFLEPVKQILDDDTAAVLVESIQVEDGVLIPHYGYLHSLRKLCDEQGALLIFDESQIGLGRTGYKLVSEIEDILPDLLITRHFSEDSHLEEVQDKGDYFLRQLQSFVKIYPTVVSNVRGRGLLVGLEITTEALISVVLTRLMEYKILARRARNNMVVILLEPPLSISYPQLDYFIAALENAIKYAEKLL